MDNPRAFLRSLLRLAILALATLSPHAAGAVEPGSPPLWRIRDADTTIVVHALPMAIEPGMEILGTAARAAIRAADEVAVVDFTDAGSAGLLTGLTALAAGSKASGTLADDLPPDLLDRLKRRCGEIGLDFATIERARGWMAALTLLDRAVRHAGLERAGIRAAVRRFSREVGTPVVTVSNGAAYLAFAKDMTIDEDVAGLEQVLAVTADDGAAIRLQARAWWSGDVARWSAVAPSFQVRGSKLETFDRRQPLIIAGWIVERLERPGLAVLVVDLDSFVGAGDVPALLARSGLAVERVFSR
ncbi:TraB/GumN family protein [Oharaeibacter diazotrophicus]|uniref:Uncharacterized protein YbaP (TraB family) n=1 Tax=Oharaeibacter diazotrophicus TaxID=1920512 RepID=A0A4R6RIV2_9HYPH|nr:TraB/GumN family protein [Oharaeibacter diazotrophicus]TDP85566.1 uncharacterized protein YbaP (TraB family) [Oharaeibacter diazotrophicus]BBE74537.1 TraB family protein [Pleomorphomonas sp. SM30]GLS75764.1 hypothetical protein GCM10007904_10990 [Oharaeibacter diazotrophicus]